ncbi:MAG: type II toxin-antitoxin system HipA family toxin [Candidatus Thiodiazotropha sp.]
MSDPDTNHGGRMRGEYRYTEEFLKHAGAFALDPFHLPLEATPLRAEDPTTGIHAVFEDSLPDAWGRAIMCRRYNLPRNKQRAAYLLELLGPDAMGALAYTTTPEYPENNVEAKPPDLSDLAAAVARFELEPDAPMDELMRLFQAGSSPGGARPKVLINNDGKQWLVKLPSIKDTLDIVRIEAATMATARKAGIEVPEFEVLDLGSRSALLVKRFDVTEQGGRNHVVSMKTLLGATNYYYFGYADMADVVRRLSDLPGKDLKGLYKQCVFNALIGNTDDHLKNFAMMRSEQGWHLTQAFDLLPDVNNNREHVLHFGAAGTTPSIDALPPLGKLFGLSKNATQSIIDEVRSAIKEFPIQCKAFAVPTQNAEVIISRIGILKGKWQAPALTDD